MRIMIADDQPQVRLGLRLLLEQLSALRVAGQAVDVGGLLAQVEACPDVVLRD